MQKKLIALAVAATLSAPAFAETTTSFYGIVDGTVANVSGSGLKGDMLALSGGLSGSRLGFKATEDMDNGMKAIALLEYALDTQTNQAAETTAAANSSGVKTNYNTMTARQQMLAVTGDFGTVATGYLQTTIYDFNAKYDPSFGSQVSPIQSVTKGGGFLLDGAARASRAVAYISPNFGPMKVAVNYATGLLNGSNLGAANNATTGLKTTAFLLSGSYEDGPLSLSAVYGSTSNDSTGATTTSEMALGGSFDLGVAKVMGTFASSNTGAATKVTNTMFSLSGVMPVGDKGAAVATYSANSMKAVDSNGSGILLAYLHNMSKTVTAYAAYESVSSSKNKNYSVANNALAVTAGGSSNLIAIGLRKKF